MKIPSDQLTLDCIKELGNCKWKEMYLWGLGPGISEWQGTVHGSLEIVTESSQSFFISTKEECDGLDCSEDFRLVCTKQYIQSPAFSPDDGKRLLLTQQLFEAFFADQNEISILERSLPYFSSYSDREDQIQPPSDQMYFPNGGKGIAPQHLFTVDSGILVKSKNGKKLVISSGGSPDLVEVFWLSIDINDFEKYTHAYKL